MSKQSEKAAAAAAKKAAKNGEAPKKDVGPTSVIVVNELPRAWGVNLSTRALDHKTAVALSKDRETENEVADSSLTVIFIPGANFFSGEKIKDFNFVKVHPDFLKMVNEGQLRVIDASKSKVGKIADAPESLAGIDGPMSISVIQGTMDAELLKTWQDEETRETVKTAIRKQLKLVKEFDEIHAAAQKKAA